MNTKALLFAVVSMAIIFGFCFGIAFYPQIFRWFFPAIIVLAVFLLLYSIGDGLFPSRRKP